MLLVNTCIYIRYRCIHMHMYMQYSNDSQFLGKGCWGNAKEQNTFHMLSNKNIVTKNYLEEQRRTGQMYTE